MDKIDKEIYSIFNEYELMLSQKEIDKIRIGLDKVYLEVFDKILKKECK